MYYCLSGWTALVRIGPGILPHRLPLNKWQKVYLALESINPLRLL